MVIGWSQREQGSGSPWAQVEAVQRDVRLPCLLIPQPAHAVLAGDLAAALLPSAFGELSPEIVRAIQMHDTGWAQNDAHQIVRLRAPESRGVPISFVSVAAAEAVEAWTASIDAVESFSAPGAIMVSRHFSLLARQDQPAHQRFLQAERLRQQRLASQSSSPAALDRWPAALEHWPAALEHWTAALGFCDLLSLYLLSGLSREVEWALAHPSSPQAAKAPRVKMQTRQQQLLFTPPIFLRGATVTVQALSHPVPASGPRGQTLTWKVA